jgi:hypothetical protein
MKYLTAERPQKYNGKIRPREWDITEAMIDAAKEPGIILYVSRKGGGPTSLRGRQVCSDAASKKTKRPITLAPLPWDDDKD